MHLRRLEMQGFKTFGTRTVLEFTPGMTAIVGPNGSGKSNAADAIRWVLGEQNNRNLRAKKSEDVIFAGSTKRSSLGMAEVTLVLDNSAGWLPIDFSEVSISRRAYRSGESEYLINNNRVRLRDVLDLLLKANVAQDSYAIMGQNMIEAVLALKPEERRVLIEEAAGVRHYRTRLDESRDRLAATRENLDRVTMLIAEISPRLTALERQAERAQRNRQLSHELSATLQAWYTVQWQAAQEALTAALARLDQAGEAARAERGRAAATEQQGIDLRAQLEALRQEIARRDAEERRLAAELRDLEQSVAIETERRGLLTVRRDEVLRDIEGLERDASSQSSHIEEDSERRRVLEDELRTAREALRERQAAVETFEARWRDARSSQAESQERATRAAAAAKDIDARLQQLAQERERLEADMARPEGRKSELDGNLAGLDDEEGRLAADEESHTRNMEETIRQHDALKRLVLGARTAFTKIDESYREASRTLSLTESRLEAVSAAQSERESIDSGMRALTSAESGIGGVVGMLTSLIQVPKGMERAIEAALAEHLQAIVVERADDAIGAIKALLTEGKGNVTVLPIAGLRESTPLNLFREKGIVGVAARLVRCDARYRRLIDTLLGRIIVVDDLQTAQAVLKRGLGAVVTMDGIFLRPVGSYSLGPGTAIQSLFDRDAQLRELPGKIAELQAQVERHSAEMDAKREAVSANESAIGTIGQKVDTMRTARAAKLDELTRLRGRQAQERGELRWVVEALHEHRDRIARADEDRATLLHDRDEFLARAEETATAAADQQKTGVSLTEQREDLMQRISDAGAHAASLEGEYRTIAALREKQETTTARLQTQIAAKRMQARDLDAEIVAVAERYDAALARLEQVSAAHGEESAAVQPLRTRWDEGQNGYTAIREGFTHGREALIEAERDEQDVRAEVARRKAGIGTLREGLQAEGLTVEGLGLPAPVLPDTRQAVPDYLRREPVPQQHQLPPVGGAADVDAPALKDQIARLRDEIRSLGPVNAEALTDYEDSRERHDFLVAQVKDLDDSEASLREAIAELEAIISAGFKTTYDLVATEFEHYFTLFFGGGDARLELTPPEDHATSGIEIMARPPGKKLQSLALLSGGERALTAVALLFALLKVRPVPFVVLDEVDAALDEANVGRFADALRELASGTQFVVVTHNRSTIERADTIYGVTMAEDGVSRLLSLRLSDLPPDLN